MLEIVPVLPVNDETKWCDPQECWTRSLWFGDLLLEFHAKDKERLSPENAQSVGIEVLRQLAAALGLDDVNAVPKAVGGPTGDYVVWICWDDYISPACSMSRNRVVISAPTAMEVKP